MNSATDRRGYVLEHRFTKFSEITQCNFNHFYVIRSESYQIRAITPFKVTEYGTNRKLYATSY